MRHVGTMVGRSSLSGQGKLLLEILLWVSAIAIHNETLPLFALRRLSTQRERYLSWAAILAHGPCFRVIAELRKRSGPLASDNEPDGAVITVLLLMDLPGRHHVDIARGHVEGPVRF